MTALWFVFQAVAAADLQVAVSPTGALVQMEADASPLCAHLATVAATRPLASWPNSCLTAIPTSGGRLLQEVSAGDAETTWAELPTDGVLVVDLTGPAAASVVWGALYSVHSKLYFPEFTGLQPANLGFPQVLHAAFFGKYAVLEKAVDVLDEDLKDSQGTFSTLAVKDGTDKVFDDHDYQLLYHRYLDAMPEGQKGTLLEIGLGCTMDYGAGASAKIWPMEFPQMQVDFIELNADCTEKWLPQMASSGVHKVHVGSQNDPKVLQEAVTEADASGSGGLQLVIDDGSHECSDIFASFTGLFPAVKPGGTYFVEDIMYSAWGTSGRQTITEKDQPTTGTPIALAASVASSIAGLPDDTDPWRTQVRLDFGAKVEKVECTPGVCVFVRTSAA